jgi:signal peptidase I
VSAPTSSRPKARRRGGDGERKSAASSAVELVVIVAIALGLALGIQAFLVKPYRIPSESMVPTLVIGQRVLVNRIGNNFSAPSLGEVVVFHPPAAATGEAAGLGGSGMCGENPPSGAACDRPIGQRSDQNFVKRVVGLPGDRIAVRDDRVIRNGRATSEPFIQTRCDGGAQQDFPRTITVPAGHYFMMGDNRECSEDSRFWGPVPRKWIIGGAFATYWPLNRIGLL